MFACVFGPLAPSTAIEWPVKLIECCWPLETTLSLLGFTAGAGTVVAVEVPRFPTVELTILFLKFCQTASSNSPLQLGHNLPLTS